MKTLGLRGDAVALVDDDDFDFVAAHNWTATKITTVNYTRYAARMISRKGKKSRLYMHREIMRRQFGDSDLIGKTVDHIDGNGLNNQKSNLRIVTQLINNIRRGKNRRNTSGYKGVTWHKRNRRWSVSVNSGSRHTFVGMFKDKIEAAHAYDKAARIIHGQEAYLNFPQLEAS